MRREPGTRALLEPREWAFPLLAVAFGSLGPYLLGRWYSHEAEHLVGALALGLAASLVGASVIGRGLAAHPATPGASRAAMVLAVLAPLAVGYLAIYGTPDGPLAH